MNRKPLRHIPAGRPPEPEATPHSFLWIGMIVFVATWTFLLGILVGRGTIPVLFDKKKIEIQLAGIYEEALRQKEALIKRYIDSPTPNLAFYDQLKQSGSPEHLVIPDKHPQQEPGVASKPAPMPSPPVPAPVLVDNPPVHPPSETLPPSVGMLPSPPTVPEPLPKLPSSPSPPPVTQAASPPPNPPGKKNLTLKASAVPSRRMAEAAVEKLRKKGYNATLITRMIPGKGVWYEISVGNIPNQAEANSLITSLRQDNLEASVR